MNIKKVKFRDSYIVIDNNFVCMYNCEWNKRDVTYVYQEMNAVGLNYGPKFSMLQDVFMSADSALY